MRQNEYIQQAASRVERLYRNDAYAFSQADREVSRRMLLARDASPSSRDLTPESLVSTYMGVVAEYEHYTHAKLKANLEILALPIGRSCNIRLFSGFENSRITYYRADDATVTNSGLLPAARLTMSTGGMSLIHPALEIAGPTLEPEELPYLQLRPGDDELGNRYVVPWSIVRAIDVA